MITLDELNQKVLEAELRNKRLVEAIPHMEALAEAEKALAEAKETAFRDEAEASGAEKTKTPNATELREKAIQSRKTVDSKAVAAKDARIKAEVYQNSALRIGAPADVKTKLVDALTSLSTWVWLVLFVALGVLVWKVTADHGEFLKAVGDLDAARALIMVLILGTTLLLAVMLCYQAYAAGTTNEQFRMAREIYTTLIGVVGTVVGFYFATSAPKQGPPTPLAVAVAPKDNALSVVLAGGKPPFKWELIEKANPKVPLDKSDAKGETEASFDVQLKEVWKGKSVMLKVTDKDDNEASSSEIKISQPVVPSEPKKAPEDSKKAGAGEAKSN